MAYTTLVTALAKSPGPFTGSLKTKVAVANSPITYSKSGEQRQSMTVGLADETAAAKAVVYDPQQFARIRNGNTVVLRNVILRADKTIVITKNSRSYLSQAMDVPPALEEEAIKLANPPPADFISITKAIASPLKTLVSVRGQIVQEDQERTVICDQSPTRVKEIFIGDNKERVKVTLWRESCDMSFRPGDYVAMTDLLTGSYKGIFSLAVTSKTTIKSSEAPIQNREINIQAIGAIGEDFEVITDAEDTITVSSQVFQSAFPGVVDIEGHVAAHAPLRLKIFQRGATVDKVELL